MAVKFSSLDLDRFWKRKNDVEIFLFDTARGMAESRNSGALAFSVCFVIVYFVFYRRDGFPWDKQIYI